MPITIGGGISIEGGISITEGFAPSVTLVYDLDAVNYSAVPLNGSTVAGTGAFPITVANAGASISWQADNSGLFRKSNATGTDVIYGGPNWVTGQSYSVFMAYRRIATSSGRLLNTQSEASKDWLMGLYNGHPNTFYPNFAVNLPASGADLVWRFGWATWNTSTSTGQIWGATSAVPTNYLFTGTNAGGGGFNQLRMFSRSAGSEVQTADIGFVKAYSGILTLADVQGLYNQYKTRFGY
jgi:hypothetical protein